MSESVFSIAVPQESPDQALVLAEELVERFRENVQMMDAQGALTTATFSTLFSPNAHLPLDFIDARMGESVSPQKYVAEYHANDIAVPLNTTYEPATTRSKVSGLREDGSRQVTIYLRSIVSHAVNAQGIYVPLLQKRSITLLMDIQVSSSGATEIIRLVPFTVVSRPTSLALDLQYIANAYTAGLREDISVNGLDEHHLKVKGPSARLSYAFTPFTSTTPDKPSRLGFRIGLGMDYLVYTSPMLAIDFEQPDYLEDDLVIGLLSGTQLNNQGIMSRDFVFSVNERFQEEAIKHWAFKASIGLTYHIGEQTQIELAYGLSSGTTVEVEKQGETQVWTTFSEGYFAQFPVVITDHDVTYQGHTIPYQDADGVYGLKGNDNSTSYPIELSTTTYAEFRLIQVFKAGTFALSGLMTVRQHLSSPLPSTGDAAFDLREMVIEGVPRTVALTERFKPMYFGLGLRLQKNN